MRGILRGVVCQAGREERGVVKLYDVSGRAFADEEEDGGRREESYIVSQLMSVDESADGESVSDDADSDVPSEGGRVTSS